MQAIRVGIAGLGTVGCAVVQVLLANRDEITRRLGRPIQVTHAVVNDINKPRSCDLNQIKISGDINSLINNSDIDIVVELIGGEDVAKNLILAAIANNKPVVSANKALLAKHGELIFEAARKSNTLLAFEAAVCGGIPIIKSLREGLAANQIQWLAGIVNGTSNFILTEMEKKNCSFEQALSTAQRLGFAEVEPALDIEGEDASHKLTLLASMAFGMPLQYDEIYVEGIAQITQQDIQNAKTLGFKIKPLAIAKSNSDGVELRVHSTLIPENCLIAKVDGVNNAVLVHADMVGSTLYCGAGAGGGATASAVIADIIEVGRALQSGQSEYVPHLAFLADSLNKLPIKKIENIESAYYLRLMVEDKPGILAEITRILSQFGISIESLLQKADSVNIKKMPVVIVTHPVLEKNINLALQSLQTVNGIDEKILRIRIELLDSSIDSL